MKRELIGSLINTPQQEPEMSLEQAIELGASNAIAEAELKELIEVGDKIEETSNRLSKLELSPESDVTALQKAAVIIENSPLHEIIVPSPESIRSFTHEAKVTLVKYYHQMLIKITKWISTTRAIIQASSSMDASLLSSATILNEMRLSSRPVTVTDKNKLAFKSFATVNTKILTPVNAGINAISKIADAIRLKAGSRSALVGFSAAMTFKNIELPTNLKRCKYLQVTPIGNGEFSVLGYTIGAEDLMHGIAKSIAFKGNGVTTTVVTNLNFELLGEYVAMDSKEIVAHINHLELHLKTFEELLSVDGFDKAIRALINSTVAQMYGAVKVRRDASIIMEEILKEQ